MPLPETSRIVTGGFASAQPLSTTSFTDLTHVPENDFLELVWENGQVMMQGQATKVGKNNTPTDFQSHNPSVRDKDLGNGTISKMEKYATTKFVQDDSVTVVPSVGMDLDKDDDIMPWLDYPFDYSELLPELSVNANDQSFQNGVVSTNKRNSLNQTSRCSQGISILEQANAPKASFSNVGESWRSNSGTVNFSHFSRPAIGRANIQDVGAAETHTILGIREMGTKTKVTCPSSTTRAESVLVHQPCFSKVDSKPILAKKLEESHVTVGPNQIQCSIASKETPHAEKTAEAVGASSSACSRNSAERASNDVPHNLKRKSCETDDSEGRSEDGEESEVVRAPPVRTKVGSKRSRAAEVHNLSERRRRDRINEKMRALQELIPNCNKVDKASMLDEAIEYLKTLQLQVQMMYMGAGFCMPSMMLPAHMGHYPPMGMPCRMGLPDLNGGAQGYYPTMAIPHMQGTYGPALQLPPLGPASFQGMTGPIPQVFWQASSQGTASFAQAVPRSGGNLVNTTVGLDVPAASAPVEVPSSAPYADISSQLQATKEDLK